jgi:hypothetical protein
MVFDRDECVGLDHDWIWKDDLLFPQEADNLLVAGPEFHPGPRPTRPPDSQFWGHFVVLKFVGRHEKLHLRHLGIGGEAAWVYFLQPNNFLVARTMTNPSHQEMLEAP